MSQPLVAKDAILWDGAAAVGFIREVRWAMEAEPIKDYKSESYDPAILEAGNRSYRVSFNRFYIDKTYSEKVALGTKFATAEIRPEGTGVDKPKIVFTNLVLLRFEGQWANSSIYESVSGEAMSVTHDVQT